jgi:hypothetical protein
MLCEVIWILGKSQIETGRAAGGGLAIETKALLPRMEIISD